jgi:hypothetical protein
VSARKKRKEAATKAEVENDEAKAKKPATEKTNVEMDVDL